MSQWYLLRGDQPHGPYEEAQIRQWIRAGQLGPTDQLCPVGGTAWRPVSDFPELFVPAATPGATEYPAPGGAPPTASAQPLGPDTASGLSAWINTGWQMVSSEWGAFVGAMALMLLITLVTIGICGPPLVVGLLRMLLRRHAGQSVRAGDVFEGFRYFGVAWGFVLIITLASIIVVGPLMLLVFLTVQRQGGEQAATSVNLLVQGVSNLLGIAIGTVTLFSMPLIADDRAGAIEALMISWNTVKTNFWTYLLAYFIFQLISSAGMFACCIGILFSVPLSMGCIVACYRSVFPAQSAL